MPQRTKWPYLLISSIQLQHVWTLVGRNIFVLVMDFSCSRLQCQTSLVSRSCTLLSAFLWCAQNMFTSFHLLLKVPDFSSSSLSLSQVIYLRPMNLSMVQLSSHAICQLKLPFPAPIPFYSLQNIPSLHQTCHFFFCPSGLFTCSLFNIFIEPASFHEDVLNFLYSSE